MLEVVNLAAGYGPVQALWDIELAVEDGEIVTILGPNGAGKTTLVNALSQLLRPWSGSVIFEGVDVTGLPPHRMSEIGVALVPEGRRVFPDMTVSENLDLGAYNRKARSKSSETRDRVRQIFPRLAERSDQRAGSLSGGEQQMLAIGRALMANPKLLLLDEPSLGLAPIIVKSIFEVLRHLNESGMSILLVEQNAAQGLELAARGYVLEEGRITLEGTSQQLVADQGLRSAYLGL